MSHELFCCIETLGLPFDIGYITLQSFDTRVPTVRMSYLLLNVVSNQWFVFNSLFTPQCSLLFVRSRAPETRPTLPWQDRGNGRVNWRPSCNFLTSFHQNLTQNIPADFPTFIRILLICSIGDSITRSLTTQPIASSCSSTFLVSARSRPAAALPS